MKHFLLPILLWALAVSAPAAPGKKVQTLPAPDGQRFLFIIDTSSSMDRLRTATETIVHSLISSGVGRQMWPGDTFGIWTFNKETSTEFPMQVWDARNSSQLGTVVAAYLSERPHEKSSNVKQMVTSLSSVVQSVSNLNVLILSDGSSPMAGTPFDTEINAHYKTRRKERSQAKAPFITTLVVRGGWIVNGSVTVAGEPINLPGRPMPEVAQAKVTPVPKPLSHTASGRETTPPPLAGTPAAPGMQPDSPGALAATTTVHSIAVPRPRVVQIVTKSNLTESVTAPLGVEPSNTISTANSIPMQTNPAQAELVGAAPTSPPATNETAAVPASSSGPLPPEPPLNFVETALAAITPAPVSVSARELNAEPKVEPDSARRDGGVMLQGVALPSSQGLAAGLMLTFGGVLLGAAAFLLIAVLRRPRPFAQGSLITQSMERR